MSGLPDVHAPGVLLLHQVQLPNSRDILESVRAVRRYSEFPVYSINALYGAPRGLDDLSFDAIVLHYSMFYDEFRPIGDRVRALLERSPETYKVVLFQDEQAYLPQRLEFCERYGIDCVFTLLEPEHAQYVYAPAGPTRIITHLPGYVSPWLLAAGRRVQRRRAQRPIDIGYRGRRPPIEWGGASQEKYEIAGRFREHAASSGLVLDIETDEDKRIYGRGWPRFIASCKAMLGTESGAELVDPKGGPPVPYRMISPRHFEAAALGTVQILYEGHYSGVLKPMVHYLPLAKDFANFAEVLTRFRDEALRNELAANSIRDLIESGRYSYESFIGTVDAELRSAGLTAGSDDPEVERAARVLYPGKVRRRMTRYKRMPRIASRMARLRLRRLMSRRTGGERSST